MATTRSMAKTQKKNGLSANHDKMANQENGHIPASTNSQNGHSGPAGKPYSNGHVGELTADTLIMDNLGKAVENFAGEGKKLTDPHAQRRQEILKKYPEIKKLMGPDTFICWVVAGELLAQLAMCYMISVFEPSWWIVLILSVVVGGTINHSLAVSIHECSHNLVFGHNRILANKIFGLIANLPLALPLSISYKKYHMDHHRMLGRYHHDTDMPWRFEFLLLKRWYTKIIWLFILPVILGARPFIKDFKTPNMSDYINTGMVILFNVAIQYTMGWTALIYLLASTLLGMGIHPSSGHFLAKHYLHDEVQATHSYYGPMNLFVFNVGYHNEHHDFPYIAYHKLPKVRAIASEYYDSLPHHTSWLKVIWDFLTTEDYGPYAYGVGYEEYQNIDKKAV